jgi:hypothetical protein
MTSSVGHGRADRFVANKKCTTARAVRFLLCKGYKKDIFEGVLTGFELHETFVFVIFISVTEFS